MWSPPADYSDVRRHSTHSFQMQIKIEATGDYLLNYPAWGSAGVTVALRELLSSRTLWLSTWRRSASVTKGRPAQAPLRQKLLMLPWAVTQMIDLQAKTMSA